MTKVIQELINDMDFVDQVKVKFISEGMDAAVSLMAEHEDCPEDEATEYFYAIIDSIGKH
jgi:hypothetical protein